MKCSRVHKEEIFRWARTPEGTKVWSRDEEDGSEWTLTSRPLWRRNKIYVVDDEWSHLRKAEIDGKQLECLDEDGSKWCDGSLSYWILDQDSPRNWRIKPDKIYEWRWVVRDKNGDFRLSSKYYKTKSEVEENMYKVEVVCKYEPSMRVTK